MPSGWASVTRAVRIMPTAGQGALPALLRMDPPVRRDRVKYRFRSKGREPTDAGSLMGETCPTDNACRWSEGRIGRNVCVMPESGEEPRPRPGPGRSCPTGPATALSQVAASDGFMLAGGMTQAAGRRAHPMPGTAGQDMELLVSKADFCRLFRDRAVVVTNLPRGYSRHLADQVKVTSGRSDVCLRTTAELMVLFDRLIDKADQAQPSGNLVLRDQAGQPTREGRIVQDWLTASQGKHEFFDADMYMFHVAGFPPTDQLLKPPAQSFGNADLKVWRIDPHDRRRIPAPGDEGVLFHTSAFSLANRGNRTLEAPKPSWRFDLEKHGGIENRLAGMSRINLKAMYSDPAQMREALAWHLFGKAGVPSPRHTYAKLAFTASYRGLFSLVEQVDRLFLQDYFGDNDRGNLYKAYCCKAGCATLGYQVGPDGVDYGRHYFLPVTADRVYRLRTNKQNPRRNNYADLAFFIETINGVRFPGGPERFDTDAFRESVDQVLNARAFLRWASVNMLLGAWDNYFATPANYYLYNSGRKGAEKDFVDSPYFTFIPWDYDNCLGIDNFGIRWQYSDIIDWAGSTERYWRDRTPSQIPLVTNLLLNREYRQYYLDHIEYLLDTEFNPKAIAAEIGGESDGGLWDRVRHAAYQESETPHGQPFTGRRYTNHEVYWNGGRQSELRHGVKKVEGIVHYVRMRRDSARAQLEQLRKTLPRSACSTEFPSTMEPLPPRR